MQFKTGSPGKNALKLDEISGKYNKIHDYKEELYGYTI